MSISGYGHAPVEACPRGGTSYKDASGPSVQGLDQVAKMIRSSTINVLFAVHDERVGGRFRISKPRQDVLTGGRTCNSRDKNAWPGCDCVLGGTEYYLLLSRRWRE